MDNDTNTIGIGDYVSTPDGCGIITAFNDTGDVVMVKLNNGENTTVDVYDAMLVCRAGMAGYNGEH